MKILKIIISLLLFVYLFLLFINFIEDTFDFRINQKNELVILQKKDKLPTLIQDIKEDLNYIIKYNKLILEEKLFSSREIIDTEFIINDIASQYYLSRSKENMNYVKLLIEKNVSEENLKIYLRGSIDNTKALLKENASEFWQKSKYSSFNLYKTYDMVISKEMEERKILKKFKNINPDISYKDNN